MASGNVSRLWRYRFMTWLAGWLLVRSGRLARNKGDKHELEHLYQAVLHGNSEDCTPDHCTLYDH